MKIEIPLPEGVELLLARIFGRKFTSNCMDSYIQGYHWRGVTYITKTWVTNEET